MNLTKYITKSCVVTDLAATSKADALKELTHLLFEKRRLKDVGPALDQIMAREVTESTGIGNGVAVPHARVAGLKSLVCAVGRKAAGLDFMAVDRKPVHLVFLICYPPNDQTTYLNFVATVAKLLSDEKHLNAMMTTEGADEMYALLDEASQTFTDRHEKSGEAVAAEPGLDQVRDTHADMILLARLQLYSEMLASARSGKKAITERMENIRSLVDPRILKHYDRLSKGRPPALVPVEGDTCQGCFMKLASKFVQEVRLDPDRIHMCTNCSRFIYVV
jgi:mannitol/fructose-specific phosphotransferase system IIA component (Ntr-type)